MTEKEIAALAEVLKPFLEAAEAIPDNWNGKWPLKAQIGASLKFPTVGQYRDLLAVAREVLPS